MMAIQRMPDYAASHGVFHQFSGTNHNPAQSYRCQPLFSVPLHTREWVVL